jgi:hypothetical protein
MTDNPFKKRNKPKKEEEVINNIENNYNSNLVNQQQHTYSSSSYSYQQFNTEKQNNYQLLRDEYSILKLNYDNCLNQRESLKKIKEQKIKSIENISSIKQKIIEENKEIFNNEVKQSIKKENDKQDEITRIKHENALYLKNVINKHENERANQIQSLKLKLNQEENDLRKENNEIIQSLMSQLNKLSVEYSNKISIEEHKSILNNLTIKQNEEKSNYFNEISKLKDILIIKLKQLNSNTVNSTVSENNLTGNIKPKSKHSSNLKQPNLKLNISNNWDQEETNNDEITEEKQENKLKPPYQKLQKKNQAVTNIQVKNKKNLTLNNLQLDQVKQNSFNPIDNYISNSTTAEAQNIKTTKYKFLNDS